MKSVLEFLKWLLESDIPVKNAASALAAFITASVATCTLSNTRLFARANQYGGTGILVEFFVIALGAFFAVRLVWTAIANHCECKAALRKETEDTQRKQGLIRDDLLSLTDGQRQLLVQYILKDTRQLSEYDIGGVQALWLDDMAVLISKNIIKTHSMAGIYEMEPAYFDYLKEHYDPATGSLD